MIIYKYITIYQHYQHIFNIYRIGNKAPEKTRPVLIKSKSEKTKWDIIKATKNLRYLDSDCVSTLISIMWDKTIKEKSIKLYLQS